MKKILMFLFLCCWICGYGQNRPNYFEWPSFEVYTHPVTKLKGLLAHGEGTVLFNAQYQELSPAMNGYIAKYNDKYGVIDRYNNVIIPFVFEDPIRYQLYDAPIPYIIFKRDGLQGVALANGEVIIEPVYKYVSYAKGDFFVVGSGVKELGIINTKNEVILPIKYKDKKIKEELKKLPESSEGLDEAKRVLEEAREVGKSLIAELTVIEKDNKYGLRDKIGREIAPCKYDYISSFDGDTAIIRQGELEGSIYRTGVEKSPIEFTVVHYGALLTAGGAYSDAMSIYDLALDLNPLNPGVYNLIGCNYYNQNQYDEAIANFDKSIALSKELNIRSIGNNKIKEPSDNRYKTELAAGYKTPVREESVWDVLAGLTESVVELKEDIRTLKNGNTSTTNTVQSGSTNVDASSYGSAGNSASRKSSSGTTKQRSVAEVGNQNADNKTYMNLETQLINMNTNYNTYNDSQRRSIQSQMKNMRTKWESKGYNWFKSSWETWDGKKR